VIGRQGAVEEDDASASLFSFSEPLNQPRTLSRFKKSFEKEALGFGMISSSEG
jgi:hypothetical protein